MTDRLGFLGSSVKLYTIGNGTDGSAAEKDLGRNYAFLRIRCEDCSNIPDSTTLSLWTKVNPTDAFCELYEINDPSTKWSKGVPTTGTLDFVVSHAFGTKYIRLDLSANVVGDVVFQIYGFDPVVFEG